MQDSVNHQQTSAGPIAVMQRYELKYLLSASQTAFLLERLQGRMLLDAYRRTSIASLYYDTPDSLLVRRSLEKPKFKKKMRLRSYGLASPDSPVYLELKRKAEDIVYKRRVQTTLPDVERFFSGGAALGADSQISREITYFRDFYGTLNPACLIIYDREAYYEPDGDLRLTVDFSPRYRMEQLNLTTSMAGRLLLPAGSTILEIKVQHAVPLWLSAILTEGRIVSSSFSKYGAAWSLQQRKAPASQPAKQKPSLLIPASA